MRYVKLFEQFKSHQEIDEICKKYDIKNYTINDDGSIDVDYSVDLSGEGLTELPLTFRNVTGDFVCSNNKITSLKGCPRNIGRDFIIDWTKVYSFENFPDFIGGLPYLPSRLNTLFKFFKKKELIDLFNEYNIIKAPKSPGDKPRLKVSNLIKFLTENDFEEPKEVDIIEVSRYYDLK